MSGRFGPVRRTAWV